MTARVLVVDDIPANVKLLEARLSAEYFDVITASCCAERSRAVASRLERIDRATDSRTAVDTLLYGRRP